MSAVLAGAAWTGHAQLFLVRGEAGIGKSLAELAGGAERRGGRPLLGQAHESDQALPFGPWVDLLRQSRDAPAPRTATVYRPLAPRY